MNNPNYSSGMGEWRGLANVGPGGGGEVLNWHGCDERGRPKSALALIDFVIHSAQLTTDSLIDASIIVQTGGVDITYEVDLSTSLAIPISGPTRIAINYPASTTNDTKPQITVRATVSEGGGEASGMVRTVLVSASLAANTLSTLIAIPRGATAASLQGTAVGIPGLEIRQYFANAAATIIDADTIAKGARSRVVSFAQFFAIFNPNAQAAVVNIKVVFDIGGVTGDSNALSLGVARAPGALTAGDVRGLPLDTVTGGVLVAQAGGGGVTAYTWVDTTTRVASGVISAVVNSTLFLFVGYYDTAGAAYIHIYNSATVPADGATPIFNIPITGAGAFFSLDLVASPRLFTTGISWAASSTANTKTVIAAALTWVNASII